MGTPMARHCRMAGHDRRHLEILDPAAAGTRSTTACGLLETPKALAEKVDIIILMLPDTPEVEGRAVRRKRRRRRPVARQARHRHELDLADRDQGIRQEGPRDGRRIHRRAGLRRRGRRQGSASLSIMAGGSRGELRAGDAAVQADGQEHHAGRRLRRRAGDQGRQPDHRRADHRGGRRKALRLRLEGGRRSGAGSRGADGRVCLLAHSRSAWRAHDQAHLRSGLPHLAAPEGSQSGAAGGKIARHLAAEHGATQELFNNCAANGDAGLDHSGLVKALERMANHAVA